MKNKISLLLTIYLLSSSALTAQEQIEFVNIKKMNKSKLREHIIFLTTRIDTLYKEIIILEESNSSQLLNSSLLEKRNNANEIEILRLEKENNTNEIESSRLNNLVLTNKNELARLKLENDSTNSKFNETILELQDSILNIQYSSNNTSSTKTNTSADFLNKYYHNQIPLPNNSFSLVLSKLVYGADYEYYNDENVVSLEMLDVNAFKYWGVKPNRKIKDGSEFKDYVFSAKSNYFDSKLPKIEILKNKLFTLKYNDGSEESFLFNVTDPSQKTSNNQRRILKIELANEEVKEDGSNNRAQDIVWKFFVIENECYLALSFKQLNRIKVNLLEQRGLPVFDKQNYLRRIESDYYYKTSYGYTTTNNEEVYLSRNQYSSTSISNYINPKKMIFLFKLKAL